MLSHLCFGPDKELKKRREMGGAYSGLPNDPAAIASVGDPPGAGSQVSRKVPIFSPKMSIADANDLVGCEDSLTFYLPDTATDGAEEYLRCMSPLIMGRDALLFVGYGLIGTYEAEIIRLEQLLSAHKQNAAQFPATLGEVENAAIATGKTPIHWLIENAVFNMVRTQTLREAIARYKVVMADIKGQSEHDRIRGGVFSMGVHAAMTREFASRLFEQIRETSKILKQTIDPEQRIPQENREKLYALFLQKLKS